MNLIKKHKFYILACILIAVLSVAMICCAVYGHIIIASVLIIISAIIPAKLIAKDSSDNSNKE